jgi:stage II sporulation protein M
VRRQGIKDAVGEHIRDQFGVYILALVVFTASVAAGALSVRLLEEFQIREMNDYFFGFVGYLAEQQPINQGLILKRAALQNGLFLLILYVSGNFFFGFIPALCLLFYRGFSIGFAVGFLAEQNSLRGVLFAIGAILPQNLIYVPAAMVASVCAVIFSLLLFRRRFARRTFPYGAYFLQYSLIMLIAAAAFALGALVETVVTPVFMRAVAVVL